MSDQDSGKHSHEDLEFIVRDKGLDVTGDLLAKLAALVNSMEGEYSSTEEALQSLTRYTNKALNQVVLTIAVLESRINEIVEVLKSGDTEQ